MKKRTSARKAAALLLSLTALVSLAAGCGSTGKTTSAASSPASAAPAASSSASGLQTLDFSTLMTNFDKDQLKSANWDRTNLVKADTTTTATIAVGHGQKTPVVMLKGNSGKLDAASTTSGTLTTDPKVNSYYASALLLKNGAPAQYGDGIFKFKMMASSPYEGLWNNAVIFRDSAPQKPLSDDAVTKALAIVTVGGVVQVQRNYSDNGKVVKQDVVKNTGVNISDNKYHYFIFAMQDVSAGTNVKLWIDGKAVYSGVVTGVAGAGAVQLLNNSTPMYDKNNNPLITKGVQEGTFQPVTACLETYVGGYDDGPAVSGIALDAVK